MLALLPVRSIAELLTVTLIFCAVDHQLSSYTTMNSSAAGVREASNTSTNAASEKRGLSQERLLSRRFKIDEISSATKSAMWFLFSQYYVEVSKEKFLRDLESKEGCILLYDIHGELQGFSTFLFIEETFFNKKVDVLFSGDTIINPCFWGQNVLHVAFFQLVVARKMSNPARPVYWYLISKGFKTYLLMAKNFPQSWPRHGEVTPPNVEAMIASISEKLYPNSWNKEKGLLIFEKSEGRLRDGVAPVRPEDLAHPDIRFFVKKNPNYQLGSELCCLAEISWRFILIQVFKQGRKRIAFFFKRRAERVS